MPNAVELVNVTKTFGQTAAVQDVSLEVTDGEFLTLLGPSGCGKTTLLRLVAGFIPVTKGSVYIKGTLVNDFPPEMRRTGMVFQNYALFPHMTVYDNIAFGLKVRKMPRETVDEKVKKVLELIRLPGFEKRYPRELSGGQQQRVALGRAIITEPDVLLLDEPLSNLDFKLRVSMRLEIKNIQKELGITTIFVTHDQGEALSMSDTIAVMNEGKIVQIGTPGEIYERPHSKFVADFIGEANLFDGTVTQVNTHHITVATDDGLELHALKASPPISIGSKISVALRPERLTLSSKPPTEKSVNVFLGTVQNAVYTGSTLTYLIRLENGRIINVHEKNFGFVHKPGEKVCVGASIENSVPVPIEA